MISAPKYDSVLKQDVISTPKYEFISILMYDFYPET